MNKRSIDSFLHFIWRHSVAKLAELRIAVPAPIRLSEPSECVWRYVRVATIAAAPWSTICMVLVTMIASFCSIGQSFILGLVADHAASGERYEVEILLFSLMALWLAAPVLQMLNNIARLYSSQNLRIGVADHLSARLMYAHPQHLARNTVGNLMERIELASASLSGVVGAIIDTIVKLTSVALMVTLVLTSVSVTIALFAGAWLLSAVLLSSYLAYTGMKIVEDASDAHARVIAELAEIITNIPLIRSFTSQRFERNRFGDALRGDLLACRRARSYWVFVLLLESVYKWLFGIAITVYIATQYGDGQLTLPQIVTIGALIIALSWHFETVAFNFVELFDSLGVLRASLAELSRVPVDLETPPDEVSLPRPGQITLRDCTVNYGTSRVLHSINLDIKAGSKVGIVGPSGSGKSTLLALLRGELQPESGEIEIHGLPLSRHSPATLAAACTEASQSAQMFNRTVRDNVAYGARSMPDPGTVNNALYFAQALDLVKGLPQGLDTLVGERGAMISTGQRQRLSIARALLNEAPLLVFDEATSSVDAVSEAAIINHLVKGLPHCTVIVVSHRIATLSEFDHVVVMQDGRIADVGSPSDLVQRSAPYRRLLCANNVSTQSHSIDNLARLA